MMDVQQTTQFSAWFEQLRDVQAKARITQRIHRLALGNPGQQRQLKAGVAEMKLSYGPGYRVYYTRRGDQLILLLCGGDKASQADDIRLAYALAREV